MNARKLVGWISSIVLLIVIGAARPAFAQDDDFRRGLQALDDKQWDKAIEAFKKAIAIRQDEDRTISGSGLGRLNPIGRTPYVPNFFLGEAYFGKDDCVNALAAWARSREIGVINKRGEFKRLDEGEKKCVARGVLLPSDYLAVAAATARKIRDVTQVADRVNTEAQANDLWSLHGDWVPRYQAARSDLQSANERMDKAAGSHQRAELAEAGAAADRALARLNELEPNIRREAAALQALNNQAQEAERLIGAAERADQQLGDPGVRLPPTAVKSRESARGLVRDAKEKVAAGRSTRNLATIADATRTAQQAVSLFEDVAKAAGDALREERAREFQRQASAANEYLLSLEAMLGRVDARAGQQSQPMPAEVAAQHDKVRVGLARARRRTEQAIAQQDAIGLQQAIRSVATTRATLEELLSAFGPLTLEDRGVPRTLQDGLRWFLEGEYQRTLDALQPQVIAAYGVMAAHGYVIRAAAAYSLFVRSGEKNQALRAAIDQALTALRSLEPGFQPDPRVFSPRFIAFMRASGSVGRSAAAGGAAAPAGK